LFVLLAFFFWPLCCLSFFNFQNLITHLVSLKNAQDRRGSNRVVIGQCLSPLNLFECRSWRGVLDTTFYAKVCDKSVAFSVLSDFSSTNKTDRHDIIEILLKVGLHNITLNLKEYAMKIQILTDHLYTNNSNMTAYISSTSICRYISTFSTCALKLSIGSKKNINNLLNLFCVIKVIEINIWIYYYSHNRSLIQYMYSNCADSAIICEGG
jgi:hypothetical protein